jgi:hypothetical protein
MKSSRFDYVKYDDLSVARQAVYKAKFQRLDKAHDETVRLQNEIREMIEDDFSGDAGDIAIEELQASGLPGDDMQRLQQSYMWVGIAIRDNQILRTGSVELQE